MLQIESMAQKTPELQVPLVHAPIRRIPNELLGEIFGWAIPLTPLNDAGRKALVDLTLVCKEWSDVAHSTHRLWSSLRLALPGLPQYQHISRWLNRARATAKTLQFVGKKGSSACFCDNPWIPMACSFEDPVLVELLASTPQLETLDLGYPSPACYRKLMRQLESSKPEGAPFAWEGVQTMKMFLVGTPRMDVTGLLQDVPPALTSLTFAVQEDPDGSRMDIPPAVLENLQHFSLRCHWSGVDVLSTLRHCTNVKTLSLHHRPGARSSPVSYHVYQTQRVDPADIEAISRQQAFDLPNVRTLDLEMSFPQEGCAMLGVLRLPAVTNLRLYHTDDNRANPRALWDLLIALRAIEGDRPRGIDLQSLTIYQTERHDQIIDAEALLDILSALPSLTDFGLEDITFAARQFFKFQQRREEGGAPKFLPHIERIRLSHVHAAFHFESLFQWIKDRRVPVHGSSGSVVAAVPEDSLKRVDVTFFLDEEDWTLNRFFDSSLRKQVEELGVAVRERYSRKRNPYPELDRTLDGLATLFWRG